MVTRKVKGYKVTVSEQILYKSGGEVRVWDTPCCFADGARVVDIIKQAVEALAIEEQPEHSSAGLQRVKIKYGDGKEGWVLYEAIEKI
jgi:hypothetical protein